MRFARRRRRARVQWMPNLGTLTRHDANPGILTVDNSGVDFKFSLSITDPSTVLFPLLQDNPVDTTFAGSSHAVTDKFSLNLAEAPSYRLRRIVGKLLVSAAFTKPGAQNIAPEACLIQAGLIVRRTDDNGNPLAAGIEQDVASMQNNQDPWIWRRDWILGSGDTFPNAGVTNVNIHGVASFPPTNTHYGSVKDGPHVDQKTNRVIGKEERLFLNVTGYVLPFNSAPDNFDTIPNVYVNFQYRVLATTFSNSGNRRNASR